jgi:hypothetical protein
MKLTFSRFFAVLGLALLSACATPKAAVDAGPPALTAMTAAGSITLFEGGCFYFSSCTTYEITLRPDGGYTLKRKLGVGGEAVSEGQLGADAFGAVERVLREARFESLPALMNGSDRAVWEPEFYPCMNHAPGMRITRRTGSGNGAGSGAAGPDEKAVYWDLGCRSQPMNALLGNLRAAMKIDELVK